MSGCVPPDCVPSCAQCSLFACASFFGKVLIADAMLVACRFFSSRPRSRPAPQRRPTSTAPSRSVLSSTTSHWPGQPPCCVRVTSHTCGRCNRVLMRRWWLHRSVLPTRGQTRGWDVSDADTSHRLEWAVPSKGYTVLCSPCNLVPTRAPSRAPFVTRVTCAAHQEAAREWARQPGRRVSVTMLPGAQTLGGFSHSAAPYRPGYEHAAHGPQSEPSVWWVQPVSGAGRDGLPGRSCVHRLSRESTAD